MYVIGTAGHVDHGKSLLVEALTGIDPDRLREEKARGMTIDLGFAWLTLPGGRSVSIVDVPGHERFIKNMLAGAGGVDLALLVVAADDGVMPQTREHVAILDLLDVRRGVVALSKRDLVEDAWLALVAADIAETLAGTTLAGSPVVPCSSLTGDGLDDLLRALESAVDGLSPKRDTGRPRLPIDRVFTIDGFGTVVTGTLIDGALAAGAELEAVPGGLRGRVRGLQSHNETVARALPGTRTAVNISGIDRDALQRGVVLTVPGWLRATDVVDTRLRAVAGAAGATRRLRHNLAVTFHTGAAEANARVRLLDCDDLAPGDEAWAQIKLDSTVAVVRGDRFVLRTPNDTVGGGVVVDAAPKRHRRRHAPVLEALAALLSGSPEDLALAGLTRHPLIDRATLATDLSLPTEAVDRAVAALLAAGSVVAVGDHPAQRLALASYLAELERRAEEFLRAYHAAHLLRAGTPREELRARLSIDQRAFDALSSTWRNVRLSATSVALSSFSPQLSPQQQAVAATYLATLRASPASPPTDAPPEPELLAHLVETGAVVDAGDGVVFDAAAFAALTDQVRRHIQGHGTITLAETRDLIGASRKYAQALLEHLDRTRVTRRTGDERVLRA